VLTSLVFGATTAFITALASHSIAADVLGRPSLSQPVEIASALLLFSPLADVLLGALTGLQRFRTLGIAQALQGLLDASLTVIGGLVWGISGAIMGYVAAEAISCMIASAMLRTAVRSLSSPFRTQIHVNILRSLAAFALPSLGTALLLRGSLWAGQLILAHQAHGLASVGIFAYANRLALAALLLPQVIGTIAFPMLSTLFGSGDKHEFRILAIRYLSVVATITASFAIILTVAASLLVRLSGDTGSAAPRTLQILAIAAIPTALNNVLSQAAVAKRKILWWLASDAVLAATILAMAFVLIPRHGPIGLALAYLIAYTLTCVAILPAFRPPRASSNTLAYTPNRHQPRAPLERAEGNLGRCPPTGSPPSQLVRPTPSRPVFEPRSLLTLPSLDSLSPGTPRTNRFSTEGRSTVPGSQRTLLPAYIASVAFFILAIWSVVSARPWLQDYPVLIFGPLAFIALQAFLPRLRFRLDYLLSPLNWAWLLFAILLIVDPMLILAFGPSLGQLSSLPADHFVEQYFLLSCLSYIGFAVGLSSVHEITPERRNRLLAGLDTVPPGIASVYIVVGLAALFGQFHSPRLLLSYFTGAYNVAVSSTHTHTTVLGAASTFLRPMGAYGLLIVWAKGANRLHHRRLRLLVCAIIALAILATYNYNRASVAIPIVALLASYGRHIRRIPAKRLLVMGLLLVLLAFLFGNYRSIQTATHDGLYASGQADKAASPSFQSQVQLYGAAPQFGALVPAVLATDSGYKYGNTLVSSVLSPLPLVGKAYRPNSGADLYNALIYGPGGTIDQVLPFTAELDWNFGPLGVLAGFALVGVLLGLFQRGFMRANGLLSTFVLQYLGMWTAFLIVGSLQVVSQIMIYFTLPILFLMVLPALRTRTSTMPRNYAGVTSSSGAFHVPRPRHLITGRS
jgi:Na+-driven multidrug efflux pump